MYPNFIKESLEKRMYKDIDKFKHIHSIKEKSKLKFPRDCKIILSEMLELSRTTIKTFDYNKITKNKKNESINHKLWLKRTELFYNILENIGKKMDKLSDENMKRQDYYIGIFGSMNASSDIDVSITYNGKGKTRVDTLIQMFEDYVLMELGISTLILDIEMYAGMLTMKCNNKDVYFVDVTKLHRKLSHSSNNSVRVLTLSSILRSIVIGMKENNVSQKTILQKIEELNKTSLDKMISSVTSSIIAKVFTKKDIENSKSNIIDYINFIYDKPNMYSNYNDCRNLYYSNVRKATEEIDKIKSDCNKSPSRSSVINLLLLTGWSDFFRAESYVLAPTVMHVVRILQSNSESNNCKYDTIYPSCAVKAMSSIGFEISALEQLGYMIRFKNNQSKYEKYKKRFEDAVSNKEKGNKTRKKK